MLQIGSLSFIQILSILEFITIRGKGSTLDEVPKVEQQFELGIAFPCKVDNFSVIEMENDVAANNLNRVVVEQHS